MNREATMPARVGFWAVLLLGVFAWAPALHPGYWQGWEGFAPVYQSVSPTALATVAAAPDLWRSAGSGAYLIAQPFLRLGADPAFAIRITFILAFVLGGSGVYAWLAGRVGDRGAGLAGLAYMLLPIFLGTVYVRGSVSDAMLLALTPLALAGLTSYCDRRSLAGAAVTVLSMLWMWRIQAGLALAITALLILYALLVERSTLAALIAAVSGAAGLVALIPLWSVSSPAPVEFAAQFAPLHTLIDLGAGALWSNGGVIERYPFQIGLVALIAGVFAVWGAAMHGADLPARLRRLLWFSVAGVAVAVVLALGVSEPLWRLTRGAALVTYPWQVLVVAAPLLVAPLALLPLIFEELAEAAYWIALMALVVLASLGATLPNYTQAHVAVRPVAILGDNQLLILDARLSEEAEPASARLEVTWQPLRPLSVDYNIFFQALTTGADGEQVVAQMDVPPLSAAPATGWRPGQVLSAVYTLDLSAAPPERPLTYYFGYYDWRDGARLPLTSGDDKLVFYGK